MKRLLLLAFLLVPSLSFAQSDTRWVGIFETDGTKGFGGARQSGDLGANGTTVSRVMHAVLTALNRTGTPCKMFQMPDSAKGWNSVLNTPNGRPAGMADTTWLRQNGCMGLIFVIGSVGSGSDGQTYEIVKYWTDGTNRGVQKGSPFDTSRTASGIPALVLSIAMARNAGVPFACGAYAAAGVSGTEAIRARFVTNSNAEAPVSGDSLAYLTSLTAQWSPAESTNVTRLIVAGDSLDQGTRMKAWKFNRVLSYYIGDAPYTRPAGILLGLAEFFRTAGYTPRRKLGLHWTLDHIYPEGVARTEPSDSFFVYAERNNWRFSTQIKAHENERPNADATVKAVWAQNNRVNRFPAVPHSHVTGVGNYGSGPDWNFSTYADTATLRGRWNFLERAISDTMGLVPAHGYERTIGFPADGVHFPHLYIFAQNGYTDIRAPNSDSTGHLQNLNAGRRVFAGQLASNATNETLPERYIEPVTGKTIWIHALQSHPGSDDTTWAMVPTDITEGVDGKSSANLNPICRAILFDQDFYWHPNENLEGPDNFMATFARRLTYFLSRVSNIVEVSPSYRPKNPRHSNIPRGS